MELFLGISRVPLLRFTLKQARMALICPGAGSISQSVCFSSTSQIWQQGKDFKSLSLISMVRPSWRCGSSRQLQQAAAVERRTSAIKGSLSAEDVTDSGEILEEHFVDRVPVGHRGAPSRSAPLQRNDTKFGRRFPGQKQVNEDVVVPAEALRQGAVFKGTVSSVQRFGAFVSFGAYADGLIHISKLSSGYVKDVNEVVELGQEVMVKIVNVEQATGRISLSLVDEHDIDLRKPYVSPGREEGSQIGDRRRFKSGSSGRFSLPTVEREERVSRGSHGSTFTSSTEYRQRNDSPQYQAGSVGNSHATPEEVQESVSSIPQTEARRAGEEPLFHPGSGRRSPFIVKEEEKNGGNPPTSTRLGKSRQEGGTSTNAPRQREAGFRARISRRKGEPFTQWESEEAKRILRDIFGEPVPCEAGEGEGVSRNSSASSRQRVAREDGISPNKEIKVTVK